jgi:hypothetical protein
MPRFPIFRLGKEPEKPALPELVSATPAIALEGLAVGVDNLRHDVALSARFVDAARAQIMRLIVRHGELEGLLAAEAPQKSLGPSWMRNAAGAAHHPGLHSPVDPSDWKPLLAELHLAALNRAKKEENISADLLARLAVTKFLRIEMSQQFAQVLERCRVLLKSYEGIRQGKAVEYRERVAAFQVRKKIILRKTGQDLFETLREIEKETLARTRRSFFGEPKGTEPGSAALRSLWPVCESPGFFRGWSRRLPVRRALCHAGQLGPRSRPLSPPAGRGVWVPPVALWRGDHDRDHRLLAVCARKRPRFSRYGHAR